MALFGKTGIGLLQELLGKAKGGIYILETKFDKKDKRLYIAYATIAPSDKQPTPFSGVSVLIRVIKDEELVASVETENVKINGQDNILPQNLVQLFWDIITEISAELESRLQKILTTTAKSIITIKSIDLINPFTIESRTASVRVDLVLGDRQYQEELPPYQIFYLGTKGLLSFLLLRQIQFLCKQTFEVDGETYIDIPPRSLANNIPKFLHALAEVGIMDVLLEDEEGVKTKLEELQGRVVSQIKKSGPQVGIKSSYLLSANQNEFLLVGLELAYNIYLVLGTPNRIPITVLTWVLDALADDVIKERLKELDLEVFYGDEERLFLGLVEDQSEEEMMELINMGFASNLYEMKVDEGAKIFKLETQKAISKYDFGNLNKKRKKKADASKKPKVIDKKAESLKKEVAKNALKVFVLFPAYDSAENELHIREFAREITVCYVSELEEDIDEARFVAIGQAILHTIRNMINLNIIWSAKGWVYFQPGNEDQMLEAIGKDTYKLILGWPQIRERAIRKRWGLSGEYSVVSHGDIYSIFKKDNLGGVVSELDHLFALKGLFVRQTPTGSQTWKRKKTDKKEQPSTLQMLEPLVGSPLARDGGVMSWLKFKVHKEFKKMKGFIVLRGDLLRNIDYLDDLLFIFNSRFGLEIPNSLLIEEVMTDLLALENEGLIKRYLINNQPITSAPLKMPENLSERKTLLLQMLPVLANRYN